MMMPAFADHSVSSLTKALVVGDSGAGKTGLLATLANGGYKLRIFDFDNGLDILSSYLTPEGAKNVHFVTLQDDMSKTPTAWAEFKRILNSGWKIGDEDLGKVESWGQEEVIVVDSMTFLGDAAKHFVAGTKNKHSHSQLELQEWGEAARLTENVIDYLTSDNIKCNLLVTSHLRYVEGEMGGIKAYPTCVGGKLPTTISRYFNTVMRADVLRGDKGRVLRTVSDHKMDLKNTAPNILEIEQEFDLAKIFDAVQSNAKKLTTKK
tara:strand:+ start:299 stop:1090 length:792 start_codon:yes stop_codon:yes gene_type:complete